MFDFAWSEIMLIGAVALIAIGPKDMPAAIRTVTGMIKKARRMAAEFQTHVDEMVREAELGDIKQTFNDLRRMDITSALEKAVDPDRSIRNTFEQNPLDPLPTTTPEAEAPALEADAPLDGGTEPAIEAPAPEPPIPPEPEGPEAPAFIPPNLVPRPVTALAPPEPPPFIPPEAVSHHQTHA